MNSIKDIDKSIEILNIAKKAWYDKKSAEDLVRLMLDEKKNFSAIWAKKSKPNSIVKILKKGKKLFFTVETSFPSGVHANGSTKILKAFNHYFCVKGDDLDDNELKKHEDYRGIFNTMFICLKDSKKNYVQSSSIGSFGEKVLQVFSKTAKMI